VPRNGSEGKALEADNLDFELLNTHFELLNALLLEIDVSRNCRNRGVHSASGMSDNTRRVAQFYRLFSHFAHCY
jgi:hypothetical protein